MEPAITALAERAIGEKVFPGCVVGVVRASGERTVLPFGRFTYESYAPRVEADIIYDIASVTKSIPIALIALAFLDRGVISLDDPLIMYVPEFANSDRERVLIRHLLTHTLDTKISMASLKGLAPEAILQTLCTMNFLSPPGGVFKYTNLPSFLLGLVIERVTGVNLQEATRDMLVRPLGLSRTGFLPGQRFQNVIVPTEVDEWRGKVSGIVHDESAYVFARDERAVGHAGLFSTAPDLLTVLEMLLHEGVWKGKRFLSKPIITAMSTNQIPRLNEKTGLGWEVSQPHFMGRFAGEHTFGKTGFTGCSVVCDIERGVAFVILSNRTYPKRSPDAMAINAFRSAVADVIFSA